MTSWGGTLVEEEILKEKITGSSPGFAFKF